jgi:ABC-type multidrug transport system fused ATPase/permease subunit
MHLRLTSSDNSYLWFHKKHIFFYDTIWNNLRIGEPKAADAEIIAAAKAAHIHDWITELPKGYDTITGERGNRLSGGKNSVSRLPGRY